jgi:hypothetical protein
MRLPDDAPPITEAERAWPYADWKLTVGRLLELGGGPRMGLLRVPDEETASVQVFDPARPAEAEKVRLALGRPVECKGRRVRLVEAHPEADRPWVKVLVS